MNRTVAVICGTLVLLALVAVFAVLKTRGALDEQFTWFAGLLVANIGANLFNIARTEEVKKQVNGRFSAQQEIARKALDVLPPEVVAQIVRDHVITPEAPRVGVGSSTTDGPRLDPPGSRSEPSSGTP